MIPTLILIAKWCFWGVVTAYAVYGLSFGIAAIFARPGGEH